MKRVGYVETTPAFCPECGAEAWTVHVDTAITGATDQYARCEQGHRWQLRGFTGRFQGTNHKLLERIAYLTDADRDRTIVLRVNALIEAADALEQRIDALERTHEKAAADDTPFAKPRMEQRK